MTAERDPSGISLDTPGAKADAGKPCPALVLSGFWPGLVYVAKTGPAAFERGAPSARQADCLAVLESVARRDVAAAVVACLGMAGYGAAERPVQVDRCTTVMSLLQVFGPGIDGVIDIGTRGAAKYTDSGWMRVPNGIERYRDALARHTLALFNGEVTDPQWGTPHAHHMAWNALAWATLEAPAYVGD